MSKRWARSIRATKMEREADKGSNYEVVTTKIKLRLGMITKKCYKKCTYDMCKGNVQTIKKPICKYAIKEKLKHRTVQGDNVEEQWNIVKTAIERRADDTLGRKQ